MIQPNCNQPQLTITKPGQEGIKDGTLVFVCRKNKEGEEDVPEQGNGMNKYGNIYCENCITGRWICGWVGESYPNNPALFRFSLHKTHKTTLQEKDLHFQQKT